jgi:hypothetical protein
LTIARTALSSLGFPAAPDLAASDGCWAGAAYDLELLDVNG